MGIRLVICCLLLISVFVCSFQVWSAGQDRNATDPGSFLSRAVETSQFQIQLAEVARTRTQDKRVVELTEDIVRDAMRALARLDNAAGATAMDVNVLTVEHQEMLHALSLIPALDFDRQFTNV